jgi:hypothetical protein
VAVHFSIRSFVLEGVLGGARVGMTRAEIRSVLGPPDQRTPDDSCWRYGFFEVHFNGDIVWLLYTDYLEPPNAGTGRTLDLWILDGCTMTLPETFARLRGDGVQFDVRDVGSSIIASVAGGAELFFRKPDFDPDDPGYAEGRWSAISVSGAIAVEP